MTAIFDKVRETLAAKVRNSSVVHDTLVLQIDPDTLLDVARALQGECEFDMFTDVTAVDWLGQQPRFEIVHHFYSTQRHVRVRVKSRVPESDPAIDSLLSLYGSARFMERECHEMYGIVFRGNADLRPILLYEGFVGHPLRKDYPKDKEQPLVPYREPFAAKPEGQ